MYSRSSAGAAATFNTNASPNKLPPKYPHHQNINVNTQSLSAAATTNSHNNGNGWQQSAQSQYQSHRTSPLPSVGRKTSSSSIRDSPSSSPHSWDDAADEDDSASQSQPMPQSSPPPRLHRDPQMDLDFGLDLRKFGLNDLNDELNAISDSGSNTTLTNGVPAIHMLSLLYDPPVEGCELKPYVSVADSSRITAVSNDESGLVEYHWYRGSQRLCAVDHCRQSATIQCLTCVKLGLEERISWFCSDKCFRECWTQHREIHHNAANQKRSQLNDSENVWPQWKYDWENNNNENSAENDKDDLLNIACKFPPPPRNSWTEVSRDRAYTPSSDDVGCCLRLEAFPVVKPSSPDAVQMLGQPKRVETAATLPVPPLPPTRPVHYSEFHTPASSHSPNTFKVVDYNILAQCYATRQIYPYTPIWALQWEYRKHRILAELISYNADIICLQEVQASAFEDFFHPSLSAVGYEGLYKRKTRESPSDDPAAIDGCAIFYRADRFTMVEQYGIEYNEAARQQTMDRKALRRMMKGNIALVAVLEELTAPVVHHSGGIVRRGRKRRLCIANTHMYWDPEFADVKLWQSYVLTQELEKLILHRQLPLVLCGDFNSLVDSSVYEFLMTQQVHHGDDVFGDNGVGDQCAILPPRTSSHHNHHGQPHSTLTHHLALTSAYAAIGEPKYTNFTGHFVGVLDYIFYSRRHLRWVSAMEVEQSERKVRQFTALPSPLFSSDHLPLVVELEWIDQ